MAKRAAMVVLSAQDIVRLDTLLTDVRKNYSVQVVRGFIWPVRESALNGSQRGVCKNWKSRKASRLLRQEDLQLLATLVKQHSPSLWKTNPKSFNQSIFRMTSVQNPHKLNLLLKLSILSQILHHRNLINLLDRQGLRVLEKEKRKNTSNTHLKQVLKNLQQEKSNLIAPFNLPITQF